MRLMCEGGIQFPSFLGSQQIISGYVSPQLLRLLALIAELKTTGPQGQARKTDLDTVCPRL